MEQTAEVKYKDIIHRERPQHALCDEFSVRHPKMQLGQRAKIFSPFSALRGFEEAIDSKLERYVGKVELNEEEQERINRTLLELVERSRDRRQRVVVTVRWYVPCSDENHEAYGLYGQYRTLTGTLRKIDPILQRAIRVDETVIAFSDISEIRAEPRSGEDG
ncbi:MAG: hypothetical protein Q4E45_06090 [Eubacteriales bacterium]|nr:hypothetical protein [Eubacteriales bacterium]